MITKSEDIKGEEIEHFRKIYFEQIESNTPREIRDNLFFDLNNKDKFKFTLTRELIKKWDLWKWFKNYKKEGLVSTAGIRGLQNVLYPWDTRYPINYIGIALATLAKALVLKEDITTRTIHKLCCGEVRYNTEKYIEIISRIQAAQGIVTHLPLQRKKTAIWMISYLIFKHDFDGGEYVTSSHAMSSKIATKDLDNQGSQFLPEMSIRFIDKIEKILREAEERGYDIEFAASDSDLILEDFDGVDEYVKYLKEGSISNQDISLIKQEVNDGLDIMYECVGGCMYQIMPKIFEKLGIGANNWNNTEEDPFFHGIGKVMLNPITNQKQFFDWGCDTTIREVIETVGYQQLLANKDIGHVTIMFDPDGDRIVLGQIESSHKKSVLDKLGIRHFDINSEKIFCFYMPNQTFLLVMNDHYELLAKEEVLDNHPRFIIGTTASARSWFEWAQNRNVKSIGVPVGFKEIANIMKKVEKQIIENPQKEVVIEDIFGNNIKLGFNPRLIFAGEESAGMITGPENLIKSDSGRIAIAMREKSAAEACLILTSMVSKLHKKDILISDYLAEIFEKFNIKWQYDLRIDRKLYNEGNPDMDSLKIEKDKGEKLRDQIDSFFLSIAIALRKKKLTLKNAKKILQTAIPEVDFSNLTQIYFVGDGTYLEFEDMYIEIRKSGTDAILKCYTAGANKARCEFNAKKIVAFNGELNNEFKKYIEMDLYNTIGDQALEILRDWQKKD